MMAATIELLRGAGFLSPLDEHFARTMGRIGEEERPEVLLAVAMASHQVGNGHVCLDLGHLTQASVLYDDEGRPIVKDPWPELEPWLAMLRSSPVISASEANTPLVIDTHGRLYLRRYWEHEARLAAALRARALQAETTFDSAWLRESLDRLFPVGSSGRTDEVFQVNSDPVRAEEAPSFQGPSRSPVRDLSTASEGTDNAEPDWQRVAALLALQRHLCVISGGPGTGKTFTVVKLLALLIEHAQLSGRQLRVTLLAPTGKAAARLSESIRTAKGMLPCAPAVSAMIPEDAATIHRGLGSIHGSATNFRHHAGNPLVTDAVLVDEASMVDLGLMSRLFAAVPEHARVILLGDADQLASVEAGAVLGDICNTGSPRRYSHPWVEQVAQLTGGQLPVRAGAAQETGLWDCIVQLTKSYRYGPESGIGRLAHAINVGDATAALAILDSSDYPDVARVESSEDGALTASLWAAAVSGFRRFLTARQPLDQLRGLEQFRILCAHRRGPSGVEAVNRSVEAALADAGLIQPDSLMYQGRPVMVTRNDYQLGLFNGDVGLLTADPERAGERVASFRTAGNALRSVSPARLPPHETVFAMSVHKSQGSEFDEVAVVLPERASPVVTRELLYTAVTRARRKVTIFARREVIEHAITHHIERASGLRDLLWRNDAPL